jgi:hypothetical protein
MAKKDLILFPVDPTKGLPVAKRQLFLRKLLEGNNTSAVAQAIVHYLIFFEENHYFSYSLVDQLLLDDFVSAVFAVIVDPKFLPNDNDSKCLVACNHLLSNIVATSAYETTEGPLMHVLKQPNNAAKVLFLYNSRCKIKLDLKKFFDVSPLIASIWYNTYMLGTSCPNPVQQENLFLHLENIDDRWTPPNRHVSSTYFTCTYLNPLSDRHVKGVINNALKRHITVNITNEPNPNKIAIITSKWHRNHAVYKSAGPLVEQLKGHYDLTLIHLGYKLPDNLITEGFNTVLRAAFPQEPNDSNIRLPDELLKNDFQLIYFPDIGMTDEDVWLSNVRLAPIQVVGYGHPATTGDNNEIDYYIGGDVEREVTDRYSEKMILLPGLAQFPAWPTYERKNNWAQNEAVQINCVWGPDKYNYTMLRILKEISSRCSVPHVYNFYPSPGINRYAGLIPFRKDVHTLLPNSIVHNDKEYYEYMESAEKGDFSINSFPFGGYNTVVESLFLGLPVITLEGDRFYNRAASHLLRQIGFGRLSSHDVNQFITIGVKMIQDADHRESLRKELSEMDIKELLFSNPGTYFKQAIDYIITNHPITTSPILIGELNAN